MITKEELDRIRRGIIAAGLKLNDGGGVDVTDVCPVACIIIKYSPD